MTSLNVVYGGQTHNLPSLVGSTLSSITSDEVLRDVFNLNGSETFEVSSNGGSYVSRPGSYVMRDGDRVRLTRPSGTKG